jgi:tetratricopeptide (TPR) repeat protein
VSDLRITTRSGWLTVNASGIDYEAAHFEDLLREDNQSEAVALYRGEFAEDLDDTGTREFEEWLEQQRAHYKLLAVNALRKYVRACEQAGAWAEMCVSAAKLVTLDPLDQDAHLHLMQALWLGGDPRSALQQFDDTASMIRRELGVPPSRELLALRNRIESASRVAIESGSTGVPTTTLCGRRRELSILRRLLAAAHNVGSTVLLLRGETGIGKTRLCEEAQSLAVSNGYKVLRGRCRATDMHRPLGAILEAFGVPSSPSSTRLTALSKLLSPYPGPEPENYTSQAKPPSPDLTEIRDAMMAVLNQTFVHGPICLILDDIQWLDLDSAALLSYVLDRMESRPLIVILAYDTSRDVGSALRRLLDDVAVCANAHIADVGALAPGEVRDLLNAASNGRLANDHREAIAQLCGGNPFFALEMNRAVANRREEPERPSDYLTDRLRNSLATRVESLSGTEVRLLEASSVLDGSAQLYLAGQVAGLTGTESMYAASKLEKRSILRGDAAKCSYQHPILREFVYARIGELRRAALHFSAAEHLAQHQSGVDMLVVARHYERSRNYGHAYETAMRACAKALDRLENERAAKLARVATSTAHTRTETVDALLLAAKAYERLGKYQELCNVLEELLDRDVDQVLDNHYELQILLASGQIECCDWLAAEDTLVRAESGIENSGGGSATNTHLLRILSLRLKLSVLTEDRETALTTSQRLNTLILRSAERQLAEPESIVQAAYTLAIHNLFAQSLTSAEVMLDSVAETAAECSTRSHLSILLARSMIHIRQADWGTADTVLSRGLERAAQSEDLLFQAHFSNNLACLALERGDWKRVETYCYECMRLDDSLSAGTHLALTPLLNLATGYFYQGRLREAEERLTRAVAMCDRNSLESSAIEVYSTRGLVALQLGRWSEAESLWERVDGLMQLGTVGVQERFKAEWFLAAVQKILRNNEAAVRQLKDAALEEQPRDLIGYLKLLWLHESLVRVFGSRGVADQISGENTQTLKRQLRAIGLGWFVRCASRWCRDTSLHAQS